MSKSQKGFKYYLINIQSELFTDKCHCLCFIPVKKGSPISILRVFRCVVYIDTLRTILWQFYKKSYNFYLQTG